MNWWDRRTWGPLVSENISKESKDEEYIYESVDSAVQSTNRTFTVNVKNGTIVVQHLKFDFTARKEDVPTKFGGEHILVRIRGNEEISRMFVDKNIVLEISVLSSHKIIQAVRISVREVDKGNISTPLTLVISCE